MTSTACQFSSRFPIQVFTRQLGLSGPETWREFDLGPGYFSIPEEHEVMVRARNIDDAQLLELITELEECPAITHLNLSENRKVTDASLPALARLKRLTWLNLSSCMITNRGLPSLTGLSRVTHLNLSYCNKLSDTGLKDLRALRGLRYLDLQGCPKVTRSGLARIERHNLEIYKP
ncbi:MAG: hypothetical protein GYA48_05625 [Chloroflexi bacterium]|nr:hypothetical protein [Chloroflexota bacterium]